MLLYICGKAGISSYLNDPLCQDPSMLWLSLKLWQNNVFITIFFNHEEEKRTKVARIPFSDSDLWKLLQYFHLWLQWKCSQGHRWTFSSRTSCMIQRKKKNKWTNLYPMLNQNWMLPRVLKHLENLFNTVSSFGPIFSLNSIHHWRGGKGWNVMRKLYSAEIYVRRTSAFFYSTSIPMSHT